MEELCDDIFFLLREHLNYIDFMSLRFTCKRIHYIPSIDPNRIIKSRLKKHIDDVESFCDNLFIRKAFISGSFILACLYNTDYYNDIDIYERIIPKDANSSYYVSSIGYTNKDKESIVGTFCNYLYEKNIKYDYIHHKPENYIIRNFGIFQSIIIPMSVPKFIARAFDLTICKVMFDGKKLYIRNWDKLITRKDYIIPTGGTLQFYYDVDILGITTKRMNKYNERGFKIERHPKYEKIIEDLRKFRNYCYTGTGPLPTYDLRSRNLNYIEDGTINFENYE